MSHDVTSDSDGDGVSDLSEFQAGTHPLLESSVLKLSRPEIQANGTVQFDWLSAEGRNYRFEVSNDLSTWTEVVEPMRGTGTDLKVSLPSLDRRLNYFFRILVRP